MPNFIALLVDDCSVLLATLRSFIERMPDVRVLCNRDFGWATIWIEAEKRIDFLLPNVWLRGDLRDCMAPNLPRSLTPAFRRDNVFETAHGRQRSAPLCERLPKDLLGFMS